MSVTINDFGASGGSHSSGVVPDPGSTAGTSKFLREDATWAVASNNPNAFYYNLAPACATLSNFGVSPQRVQLSGGGDALLTLPSGASVDGIIFRMKFAAILNIEAANDLYGAVRCGPASSVLCSYTINPGGPAAALSIAADIRLIWDSTNQKMYGFAQTLGNTSGFSGGAITPFSLSDLTALNFYIFATAGDGDGTPNTCSFTLTEFALQLE